ncbi:hypothetical protein [Mesorhizobium sp.]|uniref:hypothetical protein n=1 Tax=Mesorhizobium sp. TaxID=1871066 RepID=UPI00341F28C1
MLTEANRFIWPGPDLRPVRRGDLGSIACGPLLYRLFEEIRQGFIQALKERRAGWLPRTE